MVAGLKIAFRKVLEQGGGSLSYALCWEWKRLMVASRAIAVLAAAVLAVVGPSLAQSQASGANRKALIIGASDYAILPDAAPGVVGDLLGVRNDVVRMVRAVRDMGVPDSQVTVLADHVDTTRMGRAVDGVATRAAILRQLDRLAQGAKPGDQILVYFSGHGAQQPDKDDAFGPADEADGLDELILPVDIGYWGEKDQAVVGAITDDELGRKVEAIRAKKAFVWLIIDSCHSGTALRGGPAPSTAGVEIKSLSSDLLRIPKARIDRARAKAARTPARYDRGGLDRDEAERGGVAAFYAAGPDQLATARAFPEAGGESISLLTFAVTQVLASGRAKSYRDLAIMVEGFFAEPAYNDGFRQPGFEGDLDKAILGQESSRPREWLVRRVGDALRLRGGLLDGVAPGAIVAIRYPQEKEILAYARVDRADATTADLAPVAFGGLDAGAASAIDPYRRFVASQAAPGIPLGFRVGLPPAATVSPLVQAALDRITSSPQNEAERSLTYVSDGQAADIYLRIGPDRVWLADQPSGFAQTGRFQPPWITLTGDETADTLADLLLSNLRLKAKSTLLLRAMGQLQSASGREHLQVSYFVDRLRQPVPEGEKCGPKPPPPYSPPSSAVGLGRWLEQNGGLARLRHCDVVYVRVENTGAAPVDLTPLYFSRDGSIAYLGLGAGPVGQDVRLPPGETRFFFFRALTASGVQAYPLGAEQLALIAAPVEDQGSAPRSYAYLREASPPRNRDYRTDLDDYLEAAGFGGGRQRSAAIRGDAATVIESVWLLEGSEAP